MVPTALLVLIGGGVAAAIGYIATRPKSKKPKKPKKPKTGERGGTADTGGTDQTPEEKARILAPQVAAHVAQVGAAYNRDLVRAFQRAAGIKEDGIYGKQTQDALAIYGVPFGAIPPIPKPAGPKEEKADAAIAATLAGQLAMHIQGSGPSYNRQMVRAFQTAAGIKSDGAYGPQTRQALIDAGVPAEAAPDVASAQYTRADVEKFAEAAAQTVRDNPAGYDRAIVRAFQRAAWLPDDGIYGPATRGALIHYGIGESNAPRTQSGKTTAYKAPRGVYKS